MNELYPNQPRPSEELQAIYFDGDHLADYCDGEHLAESYVVPDQQQDLEQPKNPENLDS